LTYLYTETLHYVSLGDQLVLRKKCFNFKGPSFKWCSSWKWKKN